MQQVIFGHPYLRAQSLFPLPIAVVSCFLPLSQKSNPSLRIRLFLRRLSLWYFSKCRHKMPSSLTLTDGTNVKRSANIVAWHWTIDWSPFPLRRHLLVLKRLARVRPRVTAAARGAMVTLDRRERRAASRHVCLRPLSSPLSSSMATWRRLFVSARALIGYLSKVMYCAQLVVGQSTISGRKKKSEAKKWWKTIHCLYLLPSTS